MHARRGGLRGWLLAGLRLLLAAARFAVAQGARGGTAASGPPTRSSRTAGNWPGGPAHGRGQPPGRRRAHAGRPLPLDADGGRGLNHVRIVRWRRSRRCRKRRGRERAAGVPYRRCLQAGPPNGGPRGADVPMPGASGGHRDGPDGRSRTCPASPTRSTRTSSAAGTPGREGDVIHVFRYARDRHGATRAGTIPVPPPGDAPTPQNFPPTNTARSRPGRPPRRLARRQDAARRRSTSPTAPRSSTLPRKAVRYVKTGNYPYGAAITARRQDRAGLQRDRRHGVGHRPRRGAGR